MEPASRGYANYLTIGCRFVPNDQWLVTHLDTSWKVSEVKRWLLAKCLPGLFTPVQQYPRSRSIQRRRPVSPITFASRIEVDQDAEDIGGTDSDEGIRDNEAIDDASFALKYKYTPGPLTTPSTSTVIPTSTSVTTAQYMLLAFSTGQILEDHNYLSWYSLQPHEFLELHNCSNIVKLPREIIEDYIEPYFEVKVWAFKTFAGLDDSESARSAFTRGPEGAEAEREKARRRRAKVQWQERWVVIHRGLFRLCIERDEQYPHYWPLSALISLRGAEYLQHIRGSSSALSLPSPPSSHHNSPQPDGSPVTVDKRVICAKFRVDMQATESTGQWQSQWRGGSKDVIGSEISRKSSSAGIDASGEDDANFMQDSKGEEMVLVVMSMLEDHTYESTLRVLHRYAPSTSSTFFPASARTRSPRRRSYSPISFATGSSPHTSPDTSPAISPLSQIHPLPEEAPLSRSVRYPEWRIELMRRSRRAGLGDVGCAMEWAMFGSEAPDETPEEVAAEGTSTTGIIDIGQDPDSGSDDGQRGRAKAWGVELQSDGESSLDESASEREWENWERDLFSQRARRSVRKSRYSMVRFSSSWAPLPSTDYSFPPSAEDRRESLSLPRKTLSSYSSADSLLRRTIKRGSPRKHPRAPSPSASTSATRSRPISPLAAQLDQFDEDLEPMGCLPSHVLYSGGGPSIRNTLPLSMTMTSITSTVSVGNETTKGGGKAKGKEKEKRKAKRKDKVISSMSEVQQSSPEFGERPRTRKRSSTVQVGAIGLGHRISLSEQAPVGEHIRGRKSVDRAQSDIQNAGDREHQKERSDSSSEQKLRQPGKLKLSLSFAQVAALGTSASANAGATLRPLEMPSAVSTGSFESPRFAHPEDSD